MNPEHKRVADWDAAYVVGALAPAERREFEAHLETCDRCRQAVAELGPTVGLLSRVPAERARAIGDDDGPSTGLRSGVVSLAHRRARRRRMLWTGAAAAALVLVAAVGVPGIIGATTDRGAVHALQDLADIPLEASVRLTSEGWGTHIVLECRYSGEALDVPEGGWPYALAVVGTDGAVTTLSTWRAGPGTEATVSAGTDLGVGDIGAVEVRSIDGDEVLMRYDAD